MELYLIVVCLLEFLHNCPQLPSKMGQTGFLLVPSGSQGHCARPPFKNQSRHLVTDFFFARPHDVLQS
jgi:hypothetical protein